MSEKPEHERSDMDPRYVLYFGVAVTVVGAVIIAGMWGMYQRFERQDAGKNPPVQANVTTPVPEPRLQVNPERDLEELRRQENEVLSTYAWIDRDKGVARIPIDRAMQLFVERQKK